MPSLLISPAGVVLHGGTTLTLAEYLFRVLVYLLAFAGTGVTVFWGVRVIGIVGSKVRRGGKH